MPLIPRSISPVNWWKKSLKRFIGSIEQIPPAFSACKIDGERAYDLARKGEEVNLKPKTLVIDEIELLECNLPEIKNQGSLQ